MINGMIFIFDIVNFPFLDGDVPRRRSYGVYIYIYLYINLFALPEHLRMLHVTVLIF